MIIQKITITAKLFNLERVVFYESEVCNMGSKTKQKKLIENKKEKSMDLEEMLNKYKTKSMTNWKDLNSDLIITDPPFGIDFDGKNGNYNRDVGNVVKGYVEWKKNDYKNKIKNLLSVIYDNLNDQGQSLIFSGWNNSNIIHNSILNFKDMNLEGKLYWSYNFAPYCKKRPAHNIYEIYWLVKGDSWTYNNECNTKHCQKGEGNLSTLIFKRDYKKNMPKYPTRLPYNLLKCLLEHFTNKNDLVFDPLAGSGMLGIVANDLGRDFMLGDLNKKGKEVYKELIKHYY